MKATRVFQITALLLVVVAGVQVGWWLLDQHSKVVEKVSTERTLYSQQVAAARELLDAGVPADRVRKLLPGLVIQNGLTAASGRVAVSPEVERALASERDRHVNQYLWESAFFLLALGVCIAVIWRALHAESRVMQEQDSFLALVSHQFKTPLASLQLSLETMAIRPLTQEQSRTLIDRMLADLARMVTMVSQILDSVRFERGRVELKREPLELAGVAARIVGQFEERARNDRISITTDIPRGLEVLADPLAMDVVIRNLLENALAAVASAGGGSIALTGRRLNGEIELAVRDSGVGFKPADRPLLFKKFSRLHSGAGSSYYGTGLGLFIVRRLMQLTGGRVLAQSDGVGQGATFVLTWPETSTART
jgi:signal transduction histidine kinase